MERQEQAPEAARGRQRALPPARPRPPVASSSQRLLPRRPPAAPPPAPTSQPPSRMRPLSTPAARPEAAHGAAQRILEDMATNEKASKRRRSVMDEDTGDSDESSDGDDQTAPDGNAAARGRRRASLHLSEATGLAREGTSFLEARSVGPETLRRYREAVSRFEVFARRRGLSLGADEDVDNALVQFFTNEYFQGRHPSRGERTLSGLMMLKPQFSRMGSRKVPRAWRALRGWRRQTPTVTRKPLPWPFWAVMAVEIAKEVPSMAVFTLMGVSGYFRPSELLSLRRCDLIAPAAGVLDHWSVLLFPEDVGRASKTGLFNDSVVLDDDRLDFLIPLWRRMASPSRTELAWSFNYPEYLAAFKRAAARLDCPSVCPYQMRHSGPSIDLADHRRTLDEAQRRGRWAQARSMQRYERRARLTAEWAKVPARTQAAGMACAKQLAARILGPVKSCSANATLGYMGDMSRSSEAMVLSDGRAGASSSTAVVGYTEPRRGTTLRSGW